MTRQRSRAEDRLRRILAAVPWIAASDGPAVDVVCTRFGYASATELQADLDLLFLCGVPPYTPDSLIEVDVARGRVWIRYAPYFARPLRLTPAEALALVAASFALLAELDDAEADGPLARGLAKLAAVLGLERDDTVDVDLGPVRSDLIETLNSAATSHHQVELDYYGYGRDARSTRTVDPAAVYSAGGQWYLSGFCHRAADQRLFRIDRIERVVVLDTMFDARADAGALPMYQPRPEDPVVELELDAEAAWVAEQYPTRSVTRREDGSLRVALTVSGAAWLQRLLLRLGPQARVAAGDDAPGREAARKLLRRYGVADGRSGVDDANR